MKGVAKFSHEYVDAVGLKRWVGLELEFDQGTKHPVDALKEVEELVKKSAGHPNTLEMSPFYPALYPSTSAELLPEIQVSKVEDRSIGLTVDSINSCTDLAVLQTYKFLVRSDDKLREAYQIKEKQLMNN